MLWIRKNRDHCLGRNERTGLFHVVQGYRPADDGKGYTCSWEYSTPNPLEAFLAYSSGIQSRDLRQHMALMEHNGYDPYTGKRKDGAPDGFEIPCRTAVQGAAE